MEEIFSLCSVCIVLGFFLPIPLSFDPCSVLPLFPVRMMSCDNCTTREEDRFSGQKDISFDSPAVVMVHNLREISRFY